MKVVEKTSLYGAINRYGGINMFHARHNVLRAAGTTIALVVATVGPVSARAVAATTPSLAISGPVTLEYTATTSDTDSCTGRCDEGGLGWQEGPARSPANRLFQRRTIREHTRHNDRQLPCEFPIHRVSRNRRHL